MYNGSTSTTGKVVAHVAITLVSVLAAFVLVLILAYLIAGPSGSIATFVVLQSVLGLVVVAFIVRWRTVAGLARGLPALPYTAVPAALAYLLAPSAWTGSALFWWRLVDPGPLSFLLDLPLWVAAVGVGVLWGSSQQSLQRAPATPYG